VSRRGRISKGMSSLLIQRRMRIERSGWGFHLHAGQSAL